MNENEKRPLSDEIKGQKLPYPASQKDMNLQPDSDLSNYLAADTIHLNIPTTHSSGQIVDFSLQ